jgi:hypothetical protein
MVDFSWLFAGYSIVCLALMPVAHSQLVIEQMMVGCYDARQNRIAAEIPRVPGQAREVAGRAVDGCRVMLERLMDFHHC